MRRFKALLDHLPFDTAAVWSQERVKQREATGGWSFSDHLAVMQVETTHAVYRAVLASIPTKQPQKLPPPLHIPRPGEEKPQGPRRVSPLELIERLRR